MGRTLTHDVALAESWGYTRREAIRVVARLALIRAEEGMPHPADYLRELHRMMVATADPAVIAHGFSAERLDPAPASSDQDLILL
jgi:hypothetical protein